MDGAMVSEAMQFGMAGLIAWMWLTERRGAAARERQLTESHERLLEQRVQLDALMDVVRENTRAASALEAGQRSLCALLVRGRHGRAVEGAGAGAGVGAAGAGTLAE